MSTIKEHFGKDAVLIREVTPGVFAFDDGTTVSSNIGIGAAGVAAGVAGIHLMGDGAYAISGDNSSSMLWLDGDNDNPNGLMLTNRTAGLNNYVSMKVTNAGNFLMYAAGNSSNYGFMAYTPTGQYQGWEMGYGPLQVFGSIITEVVAVAALPASPVAGQRDFVSDSNAASFTAGIGAIVAGGGSLKVPVFYDGTHWRIG